MDSKFTESIDLSRFLPSTTNPNILDCLYEEHPVNSNKMEDFFSLPVNDEYKKNKQQKQIETIKEDNEKELTEKKEN